MESTFRPSPLAMAVLSMLHAGPLHPYAMQRLLKMWGKDSVVNVGQRANLYKTIRRLEEAGLVAVRQTERDQRYPERTVYELTEAGRKAAPEWIADMAANPRNEFPQFPAALSFIMILPPAQALVALQRRAEALSASLAEIDASIAKYSDALPRITLMDDEYQRALIAAELSWLRGVIDDLAAGTLTWSFDMLGLAAADLSAAGAPDLPAAEPPGPRSA